MIPLIYGELHKGHCQTNQAKRMREIDDDCRAHVAPGAAALLGK